MSPARHVHAEVGQDPQHVFHIENIWHIVQHQGVVGQDTGGEHGQHGILVAQRPKGSADLVSSLDDKARHSCFQNFYSTVPLAEVVRIQESE